ncbi:DUF4114 domain-containing protein [Iningainema tapete]|uniref:DUF4114 domain-containing protein n=1 Tax=Iningainema tapete BLCC-T55 TaxID=2748662 RepID=A0A8J6XST7_9CYAN|nr:DUF4114 domain-containing protein [Iningainema tapete]MBD2777709.1 DUF4114 domain-containing protein [Iningainema tapete BLCC-T55]
MNKKLLSGLFAAVTLTGISVMGSANAASLKNADEWNNLTQHQVNSKSTDNSGFQALIPNFQQYVQKEGIAIPENKLTKLDPTKLQLKSDHNVRVWFLNEGAAYKNQLAFEAINGSSYQKGMIFKDASCQDGNQCEKPSSDGKLNVGDYVDLGNLSAGTLLNFWLKANGASPKAVDGTDPTTNTKNIYGADATQNPDTMEHVIAAYDFDGYLLIGFEDLFGTKGWTGNGNNGIGSDRDFNDLVFVVDVGKDNIASVPEPATVAALLGVGAFGMVKSRRRRQTKIEETA